MISQALTVMTIENAYWSLIVRDRKRKSFIIINIKNPASKYSEINVVHEAPIGPHIGIKIILSTTFIVTHPTIIRITFFSILSAIARKVPTNLVYSAGTAK